MGSVHGEGGRGRGPLGQLCRAQLAMDMAPCLCGSPEGRVPASSTIHSTHRWGAGSSLPKALGDKCSPPPTPTQPEQTSTDLGEQQSMLDVAQASPALMRRRSFYDVETTIKLASTINGPQQKCCWKEMSSRSDLQIISLNCKVLVILLTFTDNTKAISLPPTRIPGSNLFFFFSIINFLEWKISNKYKSRENSISTIALKFSPCSLNSYQLMNNLVSSVPLPTPTLQIIWK